MVDFQQDVAHIRYFLYSWSENKHQAVSRSETRSKVREKFKV